MHNMTACAKTSGYVRLCPLSEIPRRSSRRFVVTLTTGQIEIVAIRRYTRVFAYMNCCPHVSISLDMGSDDVLTEDRRYIVCANHGALFEIATGDCIAGPCTGDGLQPVPVIVENGIIYIKPETAI